MTPSPLTGLAAPALHVEAEPARLVAARLRLGQPREPVADRGEGPGVRSRGSTGACARSAPLVDVDDLVEVLEAPDRLAGSGRLARAVERHRGRLEERLDGERRLAATRDAGHADKAAQRELGVTSFEVVAGGPDQRSPDIAGCLGGGPGENRGSRAPPGEVRPSSEAGSAAMSSGCRRHHTARRAPRPPEPSMRKT